MVILGKNTMNNEILIKRNLFSVHNDLNAFNNLIVGVIQVEKTGIHFKRIFGNLLNFEPK